MTEFARLEMGDHCAILDTITGEGLLLLTPPPSSCDFFQLAAGWDGAVRRLASYGWRPSLDDDGMPIAAGTSKDGRDAWWFMHPDGSTDLDAVLRVQGDLADEVGLSAVV